MPTPTTLPAEASLTPREIVRELDRYIVGQDDAKKAVAIALRNRWRRQQLDDELRREVVPKNILMIGPTGCGKTEIARRLSRLAGAPFMKVEATKFTEVGYVGRDVDSIIRDLMEVSISMVRDKLHQDVRDRAHMAAEDRVLDALVGKTASDETREKFREKLKRGEFDQQEIEIDVQDNSNPFFNALDVPGMPGGQVGVMNIADMLGKGFGGKMKTRRMKVVESYEVLIAEESDKLIDEEAITQEALELAENHGIVFIDEIDKISVRSEMRGGEVSREGVQRDLLPLIEGTTVSTKYGSIKTDHILFIASGAFHMAKPADLLPELQGRLPIRVELNPLSEKDMLRILTEPESSLIRQYTALIQTEGVELDFSEDAVAELAGLATRINKEVENIGARRLHTIMEKLVEEISFTASERQGEKVTIDKAFVLDQLQDVAQGGDLTKFIL